MKRPITVDPWVKCLKCDDSLPVQREMWDEFFERGHVSCSTCAQQFDLWEAVKKLTHGNPEVFRLMGLPGLGPRLTLFHYDLAPGEVKNLNFCEHGVPRSATVLVVNYTPAGNPCGCFPVELHGNQARPRWRGTSAQVYGCPLGDSSNAVVVCAAVTWMDDEGEAVTWGTLVDAFEAFVEGRHNQAIVAAHSAVEIVISRLANDFLKPAVPSQAQRKSFFKNLTSEHAAKVVLPLLCTSHGIARPPEEIMGMLTRLRKLRNDVVHRGLVGSPLDGKEIAVLLAAAAFGLRYVRFVRDRLPAASSTDDTIDRTKEPS